MEKGVSEWSRELHATLELHAANRIAERRGVVSQRPELYRMR
jgi:hypothetical protein